MAPESPEPGICGPGLGGPFRRAGDQNKGFNWRSVERRNFCDLGRPRKARCARCADTGNDSYPSVSPTVGSLLTHRLKRPAKQVGADWQKDCSLNERSAASIQHAVVAVST